MNDSKHRNAAENRDFDEFLTKLRKGDTKTWTHLVGNLRKVTVPWLLKKVGTLPEYSLVSEVEFTNEIFAESLAKFYPLFNKGDFKRAPVKDNSLYVRPFNADSALFGGAFSSSLSLPS